MVTLRSAFALAIHCWLLINSVLAGNRAWESTITKDYGNITVNRASQARPLNKRWYIIQHDDGHELWPKGNIKVCFENREHMHQGESKTIEAILRGHLEAARMLWKNRGLDDHDGWFHFEFLDVDDPLCSDQGQRLKFLMVIYAGEGEIEMATSPGRRKHRLNGPWQRAGSIMLLSDSLDVGMGNIVANFAHEMGVSPSVFLPAHT